MSTTRALPTPRCSVLENQFSLISTEYSELYLRWKQLAMELERELLQVRSDLSIAHAVEEGRHGLG